MDVISCHKVKFKSFCSIESSRVNNESIKCPASIGKETSAELVKSSSSMRFNSRLSSYNSDTPAPNIPGKPFKASFQPGFPASISIPNPNGAIVDVLLAANKNNFEKRLVLNSSL